MNKLGAVSAIIGFCTVALGAFGAHGLEDILNARGKALWDTATLYALVHTIAALAIALCANQRASLVAGSIFILGVIIFSGTLYALALGGPNILGMITPIGGACFLIGWALQGFKFLKP